MDEMQAGSTGRSGLRMVAFGLASVLAVVGLGFGVISVVNALESEACGPGGYGGYCYPPVVTVDPSTNLVDGQAVTVNGRGFKPSTSFGAAQCFGAVAGIDGCDLSNVGLTSTDTKGRVSLTMQLRRVITVQGREIDCALKHCIVGAATLHGTTPIESAGAAVMFDPAVPPLPDLNVRVTIASVTPRGMAGTVTCTRTAEAFISASVLQGTSSGSGFSRPVTCGTTSAAWSLRFSDHTGDLVPGTASYRLYASADDGLDYSTTRSSGRIEITAAAG